MYAYYDNISGKFTTTEDMDLILDCEKIDQEGRKIWNILRRFLPYVDDINLTWVPSRMIQGNMVTIRIDDLWDTGSEVVTTKVKYQVNCDDLDSSNYMIVTRYTDRIGVVKEHHYMLSRYVYNSSRVKVHMLVNIMCHNLNSIGIPIKAFEVLQTSQGL
jgi:hypothetical protein